MYREVFRKLRSHIVWDPTPPLLHAGYQWATFERRKRSRFVFLHKDVLTVVMESNPR